MLLPCHSGNALVPWWQTGYAFTTARHRVDGATCAQRRNQWRLGRSPAASVDANARYQRYPMISRRATVTLELKTIPTLASRVWLLAEHCRHVGHEAKAENSQGEANSGDSCGLAGSNKESWGVVRGIMGNRGERVSKLAQELSRKGDGGCPSSLWPGSGGQAPGWQSV